MLIDDIINFWHQSTYYSVINNYILGWDTNPSAIEDKKRVNDYLKNLDL